MFWEKNSCLEGIFLVIITMGHNNLNLEPEIFGHLSNTIAQSYYHWTNTSKELIKNLYAKILR